MHRGSVNDKTAHADDQARAAAEHAARRALADRLRIDDPYPSALLLLERHAAWAGHHVGDDQRDAASAALSLLAAARAELDALESGLLFAARTSGLTWAEMAPPMGLRSPQAVQQRLERLTARTGQR